MSTTTQATTRPQTVPIATTPDPERLPVWKHGVAAAAAAAAATTVLAGLASAAGVSFADQTGVGIPLTGFTMLTLVFSTGNDDNRSSKPIPYQVND